MEKMYDMIELAELLRLKVTTTREWARSGKIKAVKMKGTRKWLISESEVKKLLETEKNAIE